MSPITETQPTTMQSMFVDPEPEHPSPVHVSGDEEEPEEAGEAGEAQDVTMSGDVTEAELKDPENLKGIERSLYFKELEMRTQHATELAAMFQAHSAAKQKAAPAEEDEEGEEADPVDEAAGEKKEGTRKLQLALKEQGRQEGRLADYKRKFARNKVLARRKRDARFKGLRAENAEEKAMQKSITAAIRKNAKKQQDLAQKAALAAVKELESGLSPEQVKEAAMKAYAAAMAKHVAAEA